MREIVHIQAGQCGNQIGAKVSHQIYRNYPVLLRESWPKVLQKKARREKKKKRREKNSNEFSLVCDSCFIDFLFKIVG